MKIQNKYKFLKMKVKPDTLHFFSRFLLNEEIKTRKQSAIDFYEKYEYPYSKDKERSKNGGVTRRTFDDVTSFLAHYGIITIGEKINIFDIESIKFISKSPENALAFMAHVILLEKSNISEEENFPLNRVLSKIKTGETNTLEILENYREWVRAYSDNSERSIDPNQKEISSTFSLFTKLLFFSMGLQINLKSTWMYQASKNGKGNYLFSSENLNSEDSYWNYWKPNAKNLRKTNFIEINDKKAYSIFKDIQLGKKLITNEFDFSNGEEESEKCDSIKADSLIRAQGFEKYGYECFHNADHKPFLLESGLPYSHSHHAIPKGNSKKGKLFHGQDLDIIENLIPLCATCHAFVHHGRASEKKELINLIWEEIKKRGILEKINIEKETFLSLYKIVK